MPMMIAESAPSREKDHAAMGLMYVYYRVNVVEIALPPLRERLGDVELLANGHLKKFGSGRPDGFEAESMIALETYRWPGNVRERQNTIERACAPGERKSITLADLPPHLRKVSETVSSYQRSSDNDSGGLMLKEAKDRWIGQLEAAYIAGLLQPEGGERLRVCTQGRSRSKKPPPPPQQASSPMIWRSGLRPLWSAAAQAACQL
jgi:DNA-binding NtrC family response regulator